MVSLIFWLNNLCRPYNKCNSEYLFELVWNIWYGSFCMPKILLLFPSYVFILLTHGILNFTRIFCSILTIALLVMFRIVPCSDNICFGEKVLETCIYLIFKTYWIETTHNLKISVNQTLFIIDWMQYKEG